jgi:hypothetical protein
MILIPRQNFLDGGINGVRGTEGISDKRSGY